MVPTLPTLPSWKLLRGTPLVACLHRAIRGVMAKYLTVPTAILPWSCRALVTIFLLSCMEMLESAAFLQLYVFELPANLTSTCYKHVIALKWSSVSACPYKWGQSEWYHNITCNRPSLSCHSGDSKIYRKTSVQGAHWPRWLHDCCCIGKIDLSQDLLRMRGCWARNSCWPAMRTKLSAIGEATGGLLCMLYPIWRYTSVYW